MTPLLRGVFVLVVASIGGLTLYLYVKHNWKMLVTDLEQASWFVVGLGVLVLCAIGLTGWAWEP